LLSLAAAADGENAGTLYDERDLAGNRHVGHDVVEPCSAWRSRCAVHTLEDQAFDQIEPFDCDLLLGDEIGAFRITVELERELASDLRRSQNAIVDDVAYGNVGSPRGSRRQSCQKYDQGVHESAFV
jgi:hypothetical protein